MRWRSPSAWRASASRPMSRQPLPSKGAMTGWILVWNTTLLRLLVLLVSITPTSVSADGPYEQLIVFVHSGASDVDKVFREVQLPDIRKAADDMGVSIHLVEVAGGVPEAVTITPLMVYQNHRGRSIYQGRTTTPSRLRHFIRTSRFIPQGDDPNRREAIPIWAAGRSSIWAPIKISSVTGTPPDPYDDAAFKSEALKSIFEGMERFAPRSTVSLGRGDRGFYMDFYPWRSQDGTLFLSLALYSQFHCKEPVYVKKIDPLVGPWEDRNALFREAGRLMEEAVARQIQLPQSGDAFDPVARTVPTRDWNAIGFPLPPEPPGTAGNSGPAAPLGSHWTLAAPGPGDPPIIQFRFPAPLDNYTGEVTAASGALTLPEGLNLDGASGFVEVDTRSSITMGEPTLDEAIRGSLLLYTREYPASRYDISRVSSDDEIAYGQLSPGVVSGTFTLKGKSVALECPAEFEPVIGEGGEPRLIVRTAFSIDLREFDIEGAEGPAPARHTLIFDVNLFLHPRTL